MRTAWRTLTILESLMVRVAKHASLNAPMRTSTIADCRQLLGMRMIRYRSPPRDLGVIVGSVNARPEAMPHFNVII
jgi:hypothetical protein